MTPPNTTDSESEGEEHHEHERDTMVLKVCKNVPRQSHSSSSCKNHSLLRVRQTSAFKSTNDHTSLCWWLGSVTPIYFAKKLLGLIFFTKQNKRGKKGLGGTWKAPLATDIQIGQPLQYLTGVQLRRLQLYLGTNRHDEAVGPLLGVHLEDDMVYIQTLLCVY